MREEDCWGGVLKSEEGEEVGKEAGEEEGEEDGENVLFAGGRG